MTIDPNLRREVQRLDDEARALLAALTPFAARVGTIIDTVDRLYADNDDATVDRLRDEIGYTRLLDTCAELARHAGAAADDTSSGFSWPTWYSQLMERRHARYATSTEARA